MHCTQTLHPIYQMEVVLNEFESEEVCHLLLCWPECSMG